MPNRTQFERYQLLLQYIDEHIGEEMTTEKIESLSFYSYRNINRIFHALNNETIGQYIKRMRLEKAAEYLKYSQASVADIAQNVGFSDASSFSKAFKNLVGTSPSSYRETVTIKNKMYADHDTKKDAEKFKPIEYELVTRAEQHVVYSQYRGSYKNVQAMEDLWKEHIAYTYNKNLLKPDTQYFGEILDDNDITSSLNCRYNAVISIDKDLEVGLSGAFRRKIIPEGLYAKFIHVGSHATSADTYTRIYSQWMQYIKLELVDSATIEVYVSDDSLAAEDELITEIYIPVVLGEG